MDDDVFKESTAHVTKETEDSLEERKRRVKMRSALMSLEMEWSNLQYECEERNVRLITIHEMLHGYEKAVQPFMVSNFFLSLSMIHTESGMVRISFNGFNYYMSRFNR